MTVNGPRAASEWSRRLVAHLVDTGAISEESGQAALREATDTNRPVATVLAQRRELSAGDALDALAQLSSMTTVDIFEERPMGEAFKLVPEILAREIGAIGYRLENERLTLACSEPIPAAELRQLSEFLEREIAGCVLADPAGIERIMEAVYPRLASSLDSAPAVGTAVGLEPADVVVGGYASMAADGSGGSGTLPSDQERSKPAAGAAPLRAPAQTSGASATGMALGAPGAPAVASSAPSGSSMSVPGTAPSYRPPAGGGDELPPPPRASSTLPPPPQIVIDEEDGLSSLRDLESFSGFGEDDLSFHSDGGGRGIDLDELLTYAVENGASDLHLTNGLPPTIRIDGSLRPIEGIARLDNEQIREMVYRVLTQSLRERFEAEKELDTAHMIHGVGRFRVNVFQQRGSVGAVLRSIPHEIPPFDSLGLPDVVSSLAELRRGLVLVTGPTGSGKSTTLASLVNIINRSKPLHIMTVEDPIEFLHSHERAIVNQREVGADTSSFSEALRHVLRQDPDVILVGEMRDIETISTALTAAETGHLVFATLHTQDAPQTIDRIIDVFPTAQQDQIRIQLAGSLEAVVTQQLLLSATGLGRVPVSEVMICTPAIRNLIRSAKTHQVYSLMQTGGAVGMQTMDQGLARAVKAGRITEAVAFDRCHDPAELRDHLKV